MRNFSQIIESIFSLFVFAIIALAIASTTYQVFNPDGGVMRWLIQTWQNNPAQLVVLSGIALLVKRWLSGVQGREAADLMFYGVLLLGLYYGYKLLFAA